MPVKVACHCGATFTAKDELIGQTLLCPKCSEPLTIGAPQRQAVAVQHTGMADLLDEVGIKEVRGKRCPKCDAEMKPNAVLCIHCGYHVERGDRVASDFQKSRTKGHDAVAEQLLERAAKAIEVDQQEEKKNRSQGAPWWVYFLGLGGVVGFGVAMMLIPQETAFQVTGWVVFGIGTLLQLYCYIRMVMAAFEESTSAGVMFLLLPFYNLYFVFTHWDQVGSLFLMNIGGGVVQGIGTGIVAVGPMLAAKPDEQASVIPPIPVRAVVCAAGDSEFAWRKLVA